MALYVNTNVSSINGRRQLTNATNNLSTTYQRLSSGLRINSAKDDAAGLQISDRLTSQINGLNQGNRNANDGIALAHAMPANTTLWLAEVDNGIISERKARYDSPADGGEVQTIALKDAQWRPSDYTIEAGKDYQVFYNYDITTADEAKELTVFSDIFAKTYRFVGDTELYNTATGRNDALQIEVPRFALDNNYTFELNADGTAAVFDMNGTALADDDKRLIVYRIYNGNELGEESECIEGASI